jgi:hypothetical protein
MNGTTIVLGAEVWSKVYPGFNSIAQSALGKIIGKINDQPASHVISFFEAHNSIYAAENQDGMKVFIENSQGEIIANFK